MRGGDRIGARPSQDRNAGGVYRVGLPRSDLHVTLDGVELKPNFAFSGGLAFARHGAGDEIKVMGDRVLIDAEVNPVVTRLLAGGLEVTALHNHLPRASPHTMRRSRGSAWQFPMPRRSAGSKRSERKVAAAKAVFATSTLFEGLHTAR